MNSVLAMYLGVERGAGWPEARWVVKILHDRCGVFLVWR